MIDYLTNQVEVVQIEIPLSAKTGNPWLDKFGWFKDHPTFDDLLAEIEAYRREKTVLLACNRKISALT